MTHTAAEGLARALLYDRLPLSHSRAVLAKLLALYVAAEDAHVKQILAVFWPAYAQSGRAVAPFSEKGLRGMRVPATAHGCQDDVNRYVGFGVGVAGDYNEAPDPAVVGAFAREMAEVRMRSLVIYLPCVHM